MSMPRLLAEVPPLLATVIKLFQQLNAFASYDREVTDESASPLDQHRLPLHVMVGWSEESTSWLRLLVTSDGQLLAEILGSPAVLASVGWGGVVH